MEYVLTGKLIYESVNSKQLTKRINVTVNDQTLDSSKDFTLDLQLNIFATIIYKLGEN